jgi:hypothetical protein
MWGNDDAYLDENGVFHVPEEESEEEKEEERQQQQQEE